MIWVCVLRTQYIQSLSDAANKHFLLLYEFGPAPNIHYATRTHDAIT